MINILNIKKHLTLIFFTCVAMSSCGNEHSREMAENINSEFELTYRYVVKNMSVETDYSDQFKMFRKHNKDAFTSIAYTWHKISLDECEITGESRNTSNKTGYERMINPSSRDSNFLRIITDDDRACLAEKYFDNWLNIQNMLRLNYQGYQ
tara:strand:- start:1601 stop:2053 length:453 start_codon:yes stop_codon:yes gene_type:complete